MRFKVLLQTQREQLIPGWMLYPWLPSWVPTTEATGRFHNRRPMAAVEGWTGQWDWRRDKGKPLSCSPICRALPLGPFHR